MAYVTVIVFKSCSLKTSGVRSVATKLTKKKNDISFIDPVTMEVVCTYNQCYQKFTIEEFEIVPMPSGKEFVKAYHKCNECGRTIKGKGDSSRAYGLFMERLVGPKVSNE